MQFTEETFGSVKVYHLGGKIMGGPETQAMCGHLKKLIDAGTQWLVMDLQDVQWINSTGIGAIISCLITLRKRDGDVRFANLHDATAHYFHLTKLETVVKIFNRVDEAVASFA
ncbi:MAG: STAS domain-containing protein [bacterium]